MIRAAATIFCWSLLSITAAPVSATVVVSLLPSSTALQIGDIVDIEIRASVTDPIIGFGLDFLFDPSLFELASSPVVGPIWVPVSAPDGDGLAGMAFPGGFFGSNMLLATVSLHSLAIGSDTVFVSATISDPTEGFLLNPSGFDTDVTFGSVVLNVVPEPSTALLLAIGLSMLCSRRLSIHGRTSRQPSSANSADS